MLTEADIIMNYDMQTSPMMTCTMMSLSCAQQE